MSADLKSRLEQFKSSMNCYIKETPAVSVLPVKSVCELERLTDGKIITNSCGSFYLIEKVYDLTFIYGKSSLSNTAGMNVNVLNQIYQEIKECHTINDFVFLDTETTGLSGGAGTVAFLIGVGYFIEDKFIIKQFLMRDYDEEAAMLEALNDLFKGFKVIVSYNGKAFDWNLLLSRFVFCRQRPSIRNPVHADLLYPSRRLWKLKLSCCKLGVIEEQILGEKRIDDIPGMLIPGIYFKYLQDRDANELIKVLKHNELDILSLVALLFRIGVMLENPLHETDMENELLGLGRIYEDDNNIQKGLKCYEACILSDDSSVRKLASKRLAMLLKRCNKFDEAAELWIKMLGESEGFDIVSAVELAKYHEHRTKDFLMAENIVEAAIRKCGNMRSGGKMIEELEKRYSRLKRKNFRRQQF